MAFSFAKQSSMGCEIGTVGGQIPQGGVGARDGAPDGDLTRFAVLAPLAVDRSASPRPGTL